MIWRYKNSRTGDVVDLPARDASLDMLPNWSATPIDAGPAPAPPGGPGPAADPVAAAKAGVRPPEGAKKEAWIAYAVHRGMAEADAKTLRKDALIEEYGENSDNDNDDDDEEEGGGDGSA